MRLDALLEATERTVANVEREGNVGFLYDYLTFYCQEAKLTSLLGSPQKIGGSFYCYKNKLTTLEGGPEEVADTYSCCNNKLTSLEGVASHIGKILICHNNSLTSLQGIHKLIKHIGGKADFEANPIKSHVLGLLKIDGLKQVKMHNMPSKHFVASKHHVNYDTQDSGGNKLQGNYYEVSEIINKHLKGDRNIFDCQAELEDAGYEDYAQL